MKRNRQLEKEVQKLVDEYMTEFKKCDGKPHFPVCTYKPHEVAHLEAAHFTEPKQIVCPRCGSLDVMKYGVRQGVQNYICRNCQNQSTSQELD